MTCKEKLTIEHPEDIDENYMGGCAKCPHEYGYLKRPRWCPLHSFILSKYTCKDCWDRNIPETDLDTTELRETKKEKNAMSNKEETKAKLQEEVGQLHRDLLEKEKTLAKLDAYEKYEEMSVKLFAIMTSMMDAGFTRDEAFTMLIAAAGGRESE